MRTTTYQLQKKSSLHITTHTWRHLGMSHQRDRILGETRRTSAEEKRGLW